MARALILVQGFSILLLYGVVLGFALSLGAVLSGGGGGDALFYPVLIGSVAVGGALIYIGLRFRASRRSTVGVTAIQVGLIGIAVVSFVTAGHSSLRNADVASLTLIVLLPALILSVLWWPSARGHSSAATSSPQEPQVGLPPPPAAAAMPARQALLTGVGVVGVAIGVGCLLFTVVALVFFFSILHALSQCGSGC